MIRVSKSDTGQYVLVHELSQTVIIDSNLEEGFQKMQASIQERFPEMAAQVPSALNAQRPPRSHAQYGLLLFVALLPFLWLAILHYSMGTLVDDFLLHNRVQVSPTESQYHEMNQKIEQIQLDLNRLGQAVADLTGEQPSDS